MPEESHARERPAGPPSVPPGRIGTGGVLGLLARSFYLQSGWNYQTLQAAGFAYALFPVGRKLSRAGGVPEGFAERHVAVFNTNPVLASYVIGAVARMEEEVAAGARDAREVGETKTYLSVPLAAVGDRFFWATLRPFSGLLGIVVAGAAGWPGALVMLALYNAFHLYYRARGVFRGYALGAAVVDEISRLNLVKLSDRLGGLAAFLTGVFLVSAGLSWSEGTFNPKFGIFAAVAVITGVLPQAFHKRITEVVLALGVLGLALTALGLLG